MKTKASPPVKYRPNVAAIIVNEQGQMLACRRSDMPDVWQIPQGGIDRGETPEEALKRELFEEIGASNFRVLGKLPKTIRYEWPAKLYKRGYRGQEQHYYLVSLPPSEAIQLDISGHDPEFDAVEWMFAEDFLGRVSGFKRDSYTQAVEYFLSEFSDWLKQKG